ncbi:hypothetical protein [Serinicoccus sp. CNJ-927]|uniref:hypothetical protein n=1 Tax=Serinicoccus sp. CNJ-927 TaxID=1904970 RepID=UPI0009F948D0|nr:hypothetical protein [Serinicoccus sp. CNJ-927]
MTIRVRQIPAGHAYVAALLPVRPDPRTEPAVVHLPDPPVPGAPPGQWWPHPALDPAWLREHAGEQDLVHVHFGLEGQDTARLRTWLEMLREQRLPLVHTVHDLDHPQLRDQRRHREHLELLVEHAAGLLTLTEGPPRWCSGPWGDDRSSCRTRTSPRCPWSAGPGRPGPGR